MAATRITGQDIKDATITDADVASANIDGTAGTASLRTLGTGAQQAAAGNDARFPGTYADNEVPTGTVNGSNPDFVLAHTPSPTASLRVYKNGIRQKSGAGNDYTLATATITFLAGNLPQTGDNILCDYRY